MTKKILFVDDEAAVLEGLRGRLYHLRKQWSMSFAVGAEAALAMLEAQSFDVIVTDLRMPGMDGAQLLTTAYERWPEMVRIVLSGYCEQDKAMCVVRYAHQYLSKPCEPQLLENTIQRCLNLQEVLQEPRLRALVGRIRKLPPAPRIYTKLCEAMARPDVTAEEISRIVRSDMAISARLLQVVNSAFFRLARRINKIEQAVTYLGFAAIRNLVMSVEVFSQWRDEHKLPEIDVEQLQLHAQQVAAATRAVTEKTPLADDALLAGMLHDIGYLILAQECPQDLAQAFAESRATGQPLYAIEKRILGASHAEIGAYLLGIWGLPYAVIEAVAHHHEPQKIQQSGFDVLAALVVAESLMLTSDNTQRALDSDGAFIDDRYLETMHAPFDFVEGRQRVMEVLENMQGVRT